MQATAQGMTCGRGARALVVLLLLALVLTPACSSLCQAHSCQPPQAGKQDSSCHHQTDLTEHHTAGVTAAATACGVRDLQIGLPTSTGKQQLGETTLVSFDTDCSLHASLGTSAFARDNGSDGDTGSLPEFHRSVGIQFSFESFVFLRI